MAFIDDAATTHNAYRHALATEKRVRVRVEVRPLSQEIFGRLVPRGVHEIEVPASLVPQVEALVETEHDTLRAAEKASAKKLEKWIAKHGKAETFPGSVEAEFHNLTGRGVHPLVSCEVVAADIAPPVTMEHKVIQNVIANAIPANETRSRKQQQ